MKSGSEHWYRKQVLYGSMQRHNEVLLEIVEKVPADGADFWLIYADKQP